MKRLYLILGPCAYESNEQMQKVIDACKKTEEMLNNDKACSLTIANIRASFYKPRTSPGTFEGRQYEGAKQCKPLFGLNPEYNPPRLTTEIPNGIELKKLYALGYKAFWIGSRTMTNPFSVQDIADAIKEIGGKNISIGLKNPMNDDVALWYGGYKRILDADCAPYLIYRGTSNRHETVFRNSPSWDVAFKMRELVGNEITMLLDPSHIAGLRPLVEPLAMVGLSTGLFDGLMVEFHPDPDNALSDNKQQLSLSQLPVFCHRLNQFWYEFQTSQNSENKNIYASIRKDINTLDKEFFECFQKYIDKRRSLTDEIGIIKAIHKLPVFDVERYKDVIENLSTIVNKDYIDIARQLMELIHADSANRQIIQFNDTYFTSIYL